MIAAGAIMVTMASCKDEKKTDVNTASGGGDGSVVVVVDAGAISDASTAAHDADADAPGHADTTSIDGGAAADGGAKKHAHLDGGPAGTESAGESDGGHARPKTINADESSDGKTIDLAPGQSLVVTLAATPSTGFDWAVLKAPPALSAPDMGFVAGGDQVGAAGKRRLTFTVKSALAAGDHDLVLGYARSFEKGVAPFKTFKLKLRSAR